jgi:hypothetical protein
VGWFGPFAVYLLIQGEYYCSVPLGSVLWMLLPCLGKKIFGVLFRPAPPACILARLLLRVL